VKKSIVDDIAFLKASGQFDAAWYLNQYPDVVSLGMDPVEHYVRFGALLRRNPSARFDTGFYLRRNDDVRRDDANPFVHYLRHGASEGRAALPPARRAAVPHVNGARKKVRKKARIEMRAPLNGTPRRGARILDNPSIRTAQGIDDSIVRQFREWDDGQERAFLADMAKLYARDPQRFDAIEVSIVMPSFNRAFCIGAAVESVLCQTHANWRLIIVDDGSTDDTAAVLAPFADHPRIQIVRQANQGVSAARNRGLDAAVGRYVFYLDSDNTWQEALLRTLIVYLEEGALDAAYSGLRALDDRNQTVFCRGELFSWSRCCARNYIDLNTFAHRRTLAAETGTRFDESLRRLVDWDFILRLTRNAEVAFAPFAGVNYYHGEQGSRISLTEYTQGELPQHEEAIRAKHGVAPGSHRNHDALAWLKLREKHGWSQPQANRPILRFYPDYRINNPYQQAVYCAFDGCDVAPGTLQDCLALAEQRRGSVQPVIFHLHWTNPIFAGAADEAGAARHVDAFLEDARRFRDLGGRLFWTIHNVVSHESKYRDQELRLARELCALCERIHVHHEDTAAIAGEYFSVPKDKLLEAVHGSYLGLLPDGVAKVEARERLGLPAAATVFVKFGQLRAYKGLEDLLEAFGRIQQAHPDAWLVIAGKPLQIDVQRLQERVGQVRNVILRPSFVPDEEVQYYLRAADVAVLPYRNVLTSGSALLAFSYDLPVIAPRLGLLARCVDHGHNGLLYEAEAPGDGLYEAMRSYLAMDASKKEALSLAARDAARAQSWTSTSRKLLRFILAPGFGAERRVEVEGVNRTVFVREGTRPLAGARCGAIVLHYRDLEDTLRCAASVLQQQADLALVLVCNSELVDDAQELATAFPQATVVQMEDNVGYAAGNNVGLALVQEAGCEYFWILNPDVVVPAGYHAALLERVAAHPQHSFYGSIATYGTDPPRIWFGGGDVDEGGFTTHRHAGASLAEVPTMPYECDYLTGANIFGKTAVLQRVGYIPEDYFLYFEETDWFMRARRAGERPLVFPDLSLVHLKRSEAGGLPSREYCYYFVRNALIFGARYAPSGAARREQRVAEFESAWLQKIGKRAPARLGEFRRLFERARADGNSGITGRALI
jgi:GT2 family glycosyltransferase/glycosyltransferase involved in cell wall biosynthesis